MSSKLPLSKMRQGVPNGCYRLDTRYGPLCIPDIEHDLICRFLTRYGEWAWLEVMFAASLVEDHARILDAGAFVGTFGLGFSKLRELKSITFVEANPAVTTALSHNVAAIAVCATNVVEAMLAPPEMTSGLLQSVSGNLGGTALVPGFGPISGAEVPAVSLSSLQKTNGPFDLIKLDIEGMEQAVLEGERSLLQAAQTVLWIEATESASTLRLGSMLLSWGSDVFYFAFPSFNPTNFAGASESIFPCAYEAALVVSPRITPFLQPILQRAGCQLSKITQLDDLKKALWATPRWGMAEWEHANALPDIIAMAGHTLMGRSFATFLTADEAPRKTLWEQVAQAEKRQAELTSEQTLLVRDLYAKDEYATNLQAELDGLREEKYRLEALVGQITKKTVVQEDEISALKTQLALTRDAAAKEISDLKAKLALKRDAAAVQTIYSKQIEAQLSEKETRLFAVLNSTIWRVTAPLRYLVDEGRIKLRRKKRHSPGQPHNSPLIGSAREDSFVDPSHRDLIYPFFDGIAYLAANPDIAATGIAPIDHFLLYGWREGRSPSVIFDLTYYLDTNPDVAATETNPLVHYILAGKAEGRLPVRPLHIERLVLAAAKPPCEQAKDWGAASDESEPLSLEGLRQALSSCQPNRIIISISHDDYICNMGGVQNTVGDEQRAFNLAGWNYLHFSPASPLPTLAASSGAESFRLRLRLDGDLLGVSNFVDFSVVLREFRSHGSKLVFVVHHLLGHVPELLVQLPEATDSPVLVWLHDHFSICQSHTLLRNNVVFCGAPPVDSQACMICCYGEERASHTRRMNAFFAALRPIVLAPSAVTRDFWLKHAAMPHRGSAIVPPARLSAHTEIVTRSNGNALRVAHIGGSTYLKGWHTFARLAAKHADDHRYSFVHLGAGNMPSRHFEQDQVHVSPSERNAMIDAVVHNGVDVALFWPVCQETFSFTVHEAMAGGAFILARRAAGNVWPAVEMNAPLQGCAVDDEEALAHMFETGEIILLVEAAERRRFTLTPTACTADYVFSQDYCDTLVHSE